MSALRNALFQLEDKIGNLEDAARKQEKRSRVWAGRQSDLFGTTQAKAAAGGEMGQLIVDPVLLTRKIDTAIEKVEQLLREG